MKRCGIDLPARLAVFWGCAVFLLFAGSVLQAQRDISASYRWKQLLIGGGGFVTGVATHPTTPNLVYVRTDTSGAYKWNPRTGKWSELLLRSSVPASVIKDHIDYSVESIALSKQNDQVVYVAIGTDARGRILKSANQGQTWTDSGQRWWMNGNGDYREGGERLAVDPNDDSIVYFGSREQGLWVSRDAGASWKQVTTSAIPVGSNSIGTAAGVSFVAFDPAGGTRNGATRRIYVGVAGSGIYETRDAGDSWTRILPAKSVPYAGKVGPDGALWVSFTAYEAKGSLESYDPVTETWKDVSPSHASDWSFAIDPFNPKRVIAGHDGIVSGQLFQTTDGGGRWKALQLTLSSKKIPWVTTTDEYKYLSSAIMQFDNTVRDRLWFPEGLAIWQADDRDQSNITFTNVSEGIENMVTTDVIAPNGVAVTGVFDREGFYHGDPDRYPGRTHVDTVASGSPQLWGGTSLDYSGGNPEYMVIAEVQNNSPALPSRGAYSTDGGNRWRLFSSAPPVGRGGDIAVSASKTADMVWLPATDGSGIGHIPYYSEDRGSSWMPSRGISSTKTHGTFWLGSKKALDSDKVVGGKFYLLTYDDNGTFYVSSDGGKQFRKALYSPVCSEKDECDIYGQIRAVPGHANNVWSTDALGGLYYTKDAGRTAWAKIAAVENCYSVGFGKAAPGKRYPAIFIAGSVRGVSGIYRSIDEGATWQLLSRAPLGIYSVVSTINGDLSRYGRVYAGLGGNGFVYGDLIPGAGEKRVAGPPVGR